MVNVNVSGGYDGVSYPPGWTDQSNLPGSLESGGSGGSLGPSTPAANGYLAWSMIPEDVIATNAHATTAGFLTRVVAGVGGVSSHLDFVVISSGAVTNAVFALYTGPAFATGPLAWSADVHTTITGAAGLYSITWGGASSPASVNLQAGSTYWVYSEITGTSPTLGGSAGASAASMNANLTASASFANNSLTIATGPYTALTSASTITPQTTWANSATKMWFGLR